MAKETFLLCKSVTTSICDSSGNPTDMHAYSNQDSWGGLPETVSTDLRWCDKGENTQGRVLSQSADALRMSKNNHEKITISFPQSFTEVCLFTPASSACLNMTVLCMIMMLYLVKGTVRSCVCVVKIVPALIFKILFDGILRKTKTPAVEI